MLCDGNNDCGECDFVGPDCIASDEGSICQGNDFVVKIWLIRSRIFLTFLHSWMRKINIFIFNRKWRSRLQGRSSRWRYSKRT